MHELGEHTVSWACAVHSLGGNVGRMGDSQFWTNGGQEPSVELVMTGVNEDGSWRTGWGTQ